MSMVSLTLSLVFTSATPGLPKPNCPKGVGDLAVSVGSLGVVLSSTSLSPSSLMWNLCPQAGQCLKNS